MENMVQNPIRQLAERKAGQLKVELLWDSEKNQVFLLVNDDGRVSTTEVPGHCALDAFNHPYVHLV